jgi:hypothetical protein
MPWMALLVKYIRKRATAAARLPRVSASPRMEVPSFSVPTGDDVEAPSGVGCLAVQGGQV